MMNVSFKVAPKRNSYTRTNCHVVQHIGLFLPFHLSFWASMTSVSESLQLWEEPGTASLVIFEHWGSASDVYVNSVFI